jgi:Asp-tRNA(Asn)/Glu-tRNA(Gln) amidotransferase A subunit family amidase
MSDVDNGVSSVYLSATELAMKIRLGEISSFEITSRMIQRIKEKDAMFHAMVLLDEDGALLQAREADELIKRFKEEGKPLSEVKIVFLLFHISLSLSHIF